MLENGNRKLAIVSDFTQAAQAHKSFAAGYGISAKKMPKAFASARNKFLPTEVLRQ